MDKNTTSLNSGGGRMDKRGAIVAEELGNISLMELFGMPKFGSNWSSRSKSKTGLHTYLHTHARARSHARTHAHTHARTLTRIDTIVYRQNRQGSFLGPQNVEIR
ncbi:hypothetical protein EVAR_44175_1 [Eumeta japonica]|uniref:Uncharacterized protein n=1 Tax=Eumeta variegata TaxID=151549 RepID=A0A4C1W3J3_EUMVA|nr:hypothetical protein EVAR_44175_1 [Eumeta japonica]